MKKKHFLLILISIFLATEFVLGCLVQTTSGLINDIISYIIVILACFINIAFFKKDFIFLFTQLALIFTLIADWFLVILDDYYLIAMIFFSFTQFFYTIRIFIESKHKFINKIHLSIRITTIILAIIITFIILQKETDLLSIICVIYYLSLILNVIFALINCRNDSFCLIFAIGLLLFAFCDFFVGINNLSDYFDIDKNSIFYKINQHPLNFSWIFYTPSQAMLGISLLKNKFKQ